MKVEAAMKASRYASCPMANARRAGPARVLMVILSLVQVALFAGACAKARAATAPDGPPLEMPAAPPRVLAPVDLPPPVAVTVPDTPPVVEQRPPARPPARRANGTPAEADARPEPPPPAPVAVQPAPEPVPTETRELRAAPSSSAVEAERGVRELLTRATRDLNRVDYGKLSADGRTQYEQSKRFSQQAEQALRDRNFVFATTLADKAATLATELLGGR
jgi:hypothetical protein